MARIVFKFENGTKLEAELGAEPLTIGRHPENVVVLPGTSVSSFHATIKQRGDEFFVQDLGTTNGTKLNDVAVEEGRLSDRDRVTFGDVPATFYIGEEDAPPARKNTAPTPAPVALPRPAVVGAAPAPGAPIQARRPAAAPAAYRSPSAYKREGGGCAAFIVLVFFVILAFVVGLCIRHYNETGSMNLPMDIYKKYQHQKAAAEKASEKLIPDPVKPDPKPGSPKKDAAAGGAMEGK